MNSIAFGQYIIPNDANETALYIATDKLPKEVMDQISFEEYSEIKLIAEDDISHERFFGENIQRVINAFSKK